MNRIGHEAIAASAGSGKTFQLAHRYLRLLANAVPPDRIIALTFSRKAAGEIFDYIVQYLCQAAATEAGARQTAALIEKPECRAADFLALLRRLVDSLHRTHISTLDSFTIGVIQAFPLELGIGADFEILDESAGAAGEAARVVLAQILDRQSLDPQARLAFLEAFREATFGVEEKELDRSLNDFLEKHLAVYQSLPDEKAWGQTTAIWPCGSPWLKSIPKAATVADALETTLAAVLKNPKVQERWSAFLTAVRAFSPSSPWTKELEYLYRKLTEALDDLQAGRAELKLDQTACSLSGPACQQALNLVTHIIQTELSRALTQTRGIYRLMSQYDNCYDRLIRRRGRLTFTDAQWLLTAANAVSGGARLSRRPGSDARLYIDYRLDCRLDHWLLDEFQDTSDLQWNVLSNLADEILQDDSGERSFFYVGDVKQAIYGWRGGNARLFFQILRQYPGKIQERPLSVSYRSCQPIIDTVNAVFSSLPDDLPAETREQWQQSWQAHTCRQGKVPPTGYAALLEPTYNPENGKPTAEDRYALVARLLQDIRPRERGLSVAVLVRSNNQGKTLADGLRRACPDLRIVHEGQAAILDNPVVAVLLALVKFAAHPGDTFAWRHVQMSPLNARLQAHKLDRASLPLRLLQTIQREGFQGLIRQWGRKLDNAHGLDDFGRKRLNELILAAGEFDARGRGTCDAFLRFMDSYQMHELASENAVRVMTIHQSKGLGFDVVILPDLQEIQHPITGRYPEVIIARDPATQEPAWILDPPRKIVAEQDPVLAREIAAYQAKTSFEALCTGYVALTRARWALYIITSYPGKTAEAFTLATFIKMQLTGNPKPESGKLVTIAGGDCSCLYETGERRWYDHRPQADQDLPAMPEQPDSRRPAQPISAPDRIVPLQPSRAHTELVNAGLLFAPARQEALDLGTAVHSIFQQIGWLEETNVEQTLRAWRASAPFPEPVKQDAMDQFRRTLQAPAVRAALSRPAPGAELWREKPFEIVMNLDQRRRWVSGAFDRVVIRRNAGGQPHSATILDYKSDFLTGAADLKAAAAKYALQLALYARALARILPLAEARIERVLLFTRTGQVCAVGGKW